MMASSACFLRSFSEGSTSRRSSVEDSALICVERDEAVWRRRDSQSPVEGRLKNGEAGHRVARGCIRVLLTSLIVGCCFAVLCLFPAKETLRRVVLHQRDYPLTYVLTYCVAGLALPAPLLSVLAGVLLGPTLSAFIIIMVGSLSAAMLAFYLSRLLLRQFVVNRFVRNNTRLQAIDTALRRDSLALVMCTRMVLPFTFNNYFLGTTSVTATTFAVATIATGVPFAFIYALIGGEFQDVDAALSSHSFELQSSTVSIFGYCTVAKKPLKLVGLFVILCIFLFVTRTIKKVADRLISEAQQEETG